MDRSLTWDKTESYRVQASDDCGQNVLSGRQASDTTSGQR